MRTRRRALLIATDSYQPPYRNLKSPSTDLQLASSTLRLPYVGFEVADPIINPVYGEVHSAIHEFFSTSWREDHLLLYMTGHAVIEKGVYYYLLPGTRSDLLMSTALSGEFLKKVFDTGSALSRTIIVDTCHAGGLGGKGDGQAYDFRSLLGEGRSYIFAAGSGERAYERPDPAVRHTDESTRYYSLFTSAVCLALRLCRNSYDQILRPHGLADYAQRLLWAYNKVRNDDIPLPKVSEFGDFYGGAILAQFNGAADVEDAQPELATFFDRLRLADPEWQFPPASQEGASASRGVVTETEKLIDLVAQKENLIDEFTSPAPSKQPLVLLNKGRERHLRTLTIGAGGKRPGHDGRIEIFRSDFLRNLIDAGFTAAEAAEMLNAAIKDGAVQERRAHLIFRPI